MPTSIPTMRATTRRAEAMPCAASEVASSNAALTGATASPKPSPASASATDDVGWARASRSHVAMTTKHPQASAMPAPAIQAGRTRRVA